jgi:hypothetical protein
VTTLDLIYRALLVAGAVAIIGGVAFVRWR